MVRTPCFHCRGAGFDHWLGNYYLTSHQVQPKKKKKEFVWGRESKESTTRV